MAGEAEGFMRRIIERGHAGDMEAMKFVLDRVYPRPRDRSVTFELPPIDTPDDLRTAMQAVEMTSGELTPKEVADVMKVIEAAGRVLEVAAAAEERLARMEQAIVAQSAKVADAPSAAASIAETSQSTPVIAKPPLAKTSEIQAPPPGHPPARAANSAHPASPG
jgi:hypothetical protein